MNSAENKSSSIFLWIPFIWYSISITRPITIWMDPFLGIPSNIDPTEGSPLERIVWTILIVAGLLILMKKRIQWSQVIRNNKWIFSLLLYTMISILWSNFQGVALKRWIKTFGSIVMALIVLTEPRPVQAISTLLRRAFLLHIPLDIIVIKYFRHIGVGYSKKGLEMWTGLTTHKNTLGEVCMISGLYFTWDIFNKLGKSRVIIDLFYLAMIMFLMNGPGYSSSTTAMVVLFIGLLIFFSFRLAPKEEILLNRFIFTGGISLLFLLITMQIGITAFTGNRTLTTVSLEIAGRDSTFTGRTDLWGDVLLDASKHPLKGVGYGSYWIDNLANNLWDKYDWRPNQGHNGYVDVYVELGMIGLFLLGGLLISTFHKIKKMIIDDFEFGHFFMALFVMIVIHNITESSFLRGDHHLWFFFLLISLTIPSSSLGRDSVTATRREYND